jgi:hypothetical protein
MVVITVIEFNTLLIPSQVRSVCIATRICAERLRRRGWIPRTGIPGWLWSLNCLPSNWFRCYLSGDNAYGAFSWSLNSTPSNVFLAWHLIKHKENFTASFPLNSVTYDNLYYSVHQTVDIVALNPKASIFFLNTSVYTRRKISPSLRYVTKRGEGMTENRKGKGAIQVLPVCVASLWCSSPSTYLVWSAHVTLCNGQRSSDIFCYILYIENVGTYLPDYTSHIRRE